MTITLTKNEIKTIISVLGMEKMELQALINIESTANKSELRNEIVTIEKILTKLGDRNEFTSI